MTPADRRIAGCPDSCRRDDPHLHRAEPMSPFVRRALRGELPASDRTGEIRR